MFFTYDLIHHRYVEQEDERATYQKKIEEYREKVAEEFRKKFDKDVDVEECMIVRDKDGNIVNTGGSNVVNGVRRTRSDELISSAFGSGSKEEEDEKKATGFYLPGFFEVFPELKFKWPIWARKKDGGAIECESDRDCMFPQACCNHPFFTKKFCCTGYGQRIMEPAFVEQVIQGDVAMGRKVGENDPPERDDREPWRPNDR